MSGKITRILVTATVLSAAGIGMWAAHEGFTGEAIQPVKNDRWTYGYGSTTRPNGKPVEAGDTITPPQALRLTLDYLDRAQETLRACLGDEVALTQYEWDALIDLAGNVGANAVCNSSIVPKLQAGEYEAACKTIPTFNKVQGHNCCLPENKRFCGGICKRRQETERLCLEGIYP
jgi:lysozyme